MKLIMENWKRYLKEDRGTERSVKDAIDFYIRWGTDPGGNVAGLPRVGGYNPSHSDKSHEEIKRLVLSAFTEHRPDTDDFNVHEDAVREAPADIVFSVLKVYQDSKARV